MWPRLTVFMSRVLGARTQSPDGHVPWTPCLLHTHVMKTLWALWTRFQACKKGSPVCAHTHPHMHTQTYTLLFGPCLKFLYVDSYSVFCGGSVPLGGFQLVNTEAMAPSSIPPRRNHATVLLLGTRGTHVAERLLCLTCLRCNLGGCLVRVDGIHLSRVFVSGFKMIASPVEL